MANMKDPSMHARLPFSSGGRRQCRSGPGEAFHRRVPRALAPSGSPHITARSTPGLTLHTDQAPVALVVACKLIRTLSLAEIRRDAGACQRYHQRRFDKELGYHPHPEKGTFLVDQCPGGGIIGTLRHAAHPPVRRHAIEGRRVSFWKRGGSQLGDACSPTHPESARTPSF